MKDNILNNTSVAIIANGSFSDSEHIKKKLQSFQYFACCDGGIENLLKHNLEPNVIIGDLDSINKRLKEKYNDKLVHLKDQNKNDLRKTISWLSNKNIKKASIFFATGNREDHNIGNIFTILQYQTNLELKIIGEYGNFSIIHKTKTLSSFKGQNISLFSTDPTIIIKTQNLQYNLNGTLSNLYQGTLNKSIDLNFKISLSHGKILIYQENILN